MILIERWVQIRIQCIAYTVNYISYKVYKFYKKKYVKMTTIDHIFTMYGQYGC